MKHPSISSFITRLLAGILLTLAASQARASDTQMSDELQQMVIEDQRDRTSARGKPWPEAL